MWIHLCINMRVKFTKLGPHILFIQIKHAMYIGFLSFIDTQIIDNPWIFQAPHFKDFYCSRNAGCKNALFEFTIQLFWGQRYFYLFSLWDRQHTTQCCEIWKKCAMVKNKNILENFILAFVIFDDDIFVFFLLIASFFQY